MGRPRERADAPLPRLTMTAPARITQADMERATKAVKAAGIDRARIRMDLANGVIDVIIGDSGTVEPEPEENPLDKLLGLK